MATSIKRYRPTSPARRYHEVLVQPELSKSNGVSSAIMPVVFVTAPAKLLATTE